MFEESDLDLFIQELTGVKQKWYEIGVGLGYSITLDNIRRENSDPGICLRNLLRKQLQYPTTWRNIADALRSCDVEESQLADKLEAKYSPSEFNISLYLSEYNAVQPCTEMGSSRPNESIGKQVPIRSHNTKMLGTYSMRGKPGYISCQRYIPTNFGHPRNAR